MLKLFTIFTIFTIAILLTSAYSENSVGWDNGLTYRRSIKQHSFGVSVNTWLNVDYMKYDKNPHLKDGFSYWSGNSFDLSLQYLFFIKINETISIGPYLRAGNTFYAYSDYFWNNIHFNPMFAQKYAINSHLYLESKIGLKLTYEPHYSWWYYDDNGRTDVNGQRWNFEFDDEVISNLGIFYTF